jgi:hypothetical protein
MIRCPDQSIGLLEYDFPETESPDSSEFVSMINAARETKLVADDDGNVEQTHAEITLDSIERLKNAEIPLKEHKDTWVVATSNELETDGGYNDSTGANRSADPRQQVADMLSQRFKAWASSTVLGFSKAMFWTICTPSIILFYPVDQYGTFGEFREDVENTTWKLWTVLGMSLLAWVTTYATVF